MEIALVVAVGGGIWYAHTRLGGEAAAAITAQAQRDRQISVRGLTGSEKDACFNDQRVQQALLRAASA